MQHRLQVDGDPASVEHATTGLRKTETGTVEPQPTRPLATPALPTGAVVALVVGAVLLIAGVFGDGGIVSFVIGLLLLIHGARRLARLRRDDTDARRQALQRIAAILNSPSKR
jgi:hypothetical protein